MEDLSSRFTASPPAMRTEFHVREEFEHRRPVWPVLVIEGVAASHTHGVEAIPWIAVLVVSPLPVRSPLRCGDFERPSHALCLGCSV